MATDADIESATLARLAATPLACTELTRLNGGTANFVYVGRLRSAYRVPPIADIKGTAEEEITNVIVKHTTDYVAMNREFKLDGERCVFEETMLRALHAFPPIRGPDSTITVRTPRLYQYDHESHTQVMEHLADSKDLKSWLLSEQGGQCASESAAREIGYALGSWLAAFHSWSSCSQQASLRATMAGNRTMQKLKNLVNYEKLPSMVDEYPDILGPARAVFEEVRDSVAAEIEQQQPQPAGNQAHEEEYGLIHGDFWTGNVLVSDHVLFVVDWELSHVGFRALDLGQMLAELFEAKHFRGVDAGVWILQALIERYDLLLTLDMAFRVAVHVGVHLVSFSVVPGWGSQQQVEDVVRVGREFVVRGWMRDRDWFVHEGTLAGLFEGLQV